MDTDSVIPSIKIDEIYKDAEGVENGLIHHIMMKEE